MAAEVFRHEQYNDRVDIYALGMIMFYLFHGEPPFAGMPPIEAAKAAALRNLRPVISPKLPAVLRQLISACWHPNPATRPAAREVSDTLEALFPQADTVVEDLIGEGCKCAIA